MLGWVDLKQTFFFSCLVDFRSGFWHWKWLPEGVTHSSTSPEYFFFASHFVDLRIGFWPQKGHPKWSPGRVLAKLFFHISLSWPQNRVLTPKRVTPSGHPVEVGWYFCRTTVRVQRAASSMRSGITGCRKSTMTATTLEMIQHFWLQHRWTHRPPKKRLFHISTTTTIIEASMYGC